MPFPREDATPPVTKMCFVKFRLLGPSNYDGITP
jgi:hypothetical protein